MAKQSPQAAARTRLTDDGYHVETVEQWVSMGAKGGFRRDLLGFIDLLCFKGGEVLAVQVTSAGNVSSRIRKIEQSDRVHHARKAGWTLQVWGLRPSGEFRIEDVS